MSNNIFKFGCLGLHYKTVFLMAHGYNISILFVRCIQNHFRQSSGNNTIPDHVSSTRTFIHRRLSNVRAGLVRSRRNVMSMFHKQHSDEIELSGGK